MTTMTNYSASAGGLMQKAVWGLLALLVLQLIGSFVAGRGDGAYAPATASGKLIELTAGDVSKITISDGNSSEVLTKSGDHWQSDNGLPANPSMVKSLLDDLVALQASAPVATNESSYQRLKVADDDYYRKLTLALSNGKQIELLVGNSPGFKQSYLRLTGATEVVTGKVNRFGMGLKASDWLDHALLSVKQPVSIQQGDLTLVKREDSWYLQQSGQTDVAADKGKALALVTAFENLDVEQQLDAAKTSAPATKSPDNGPLTDLRVTAANGEQVVFNRRRAGDQFLLRRQDVANGGWFQVSRQVWDKLSGSLSQLVATSGAADTAAE
ncbi:DUF4340 domain-containing protein [Oceanobacter mangrovi]|uniref:DUF4340 domain-containing protein n=1 Tax=Oceanobacter mangrovi TaxID=2862510 RepID=UPI001C8DD186|nr:DUF4340 domain-containing protein [Oceanobacter mangrovi]